MDRLTIVGRLMDVLFRCRFKVDRSTTVVAGAGGVKRIKRFGMLLHHDASIVVDRSIDRLIDIVSLLLQSASTDCCFAVVAAAADRSAVVLLPLLLPLIGPLLFLLLLLLIWNSEHENYDKSID